MSLKRINNRLKILVVISGLLIPLLIFLNRFLIPDSSFDSVNYHVFLGQRSFDFWKFNQYEFYPTGLHSFPYFFDAFGGALRLLFGYRLGAGTSLIFLYGVMFLAYKFINLLDKKFLITRDWLSVFLFINIFISFEAYFQLATYFVDIISEFFIFLSLLFAFKYLKNLENKWLWWSSLVMGLAVMGKLTNLIFALPLGLSLMYFVWIKNKSDKFQKLLTTLKVSFLLVLPLLIVSIPNLIRTGNPVFPFYNAFFKSQYADPVSFKNTFFGAITLKEKVFWPIITLKESVRLGEAHDLFNDFKLNIYFIMGILSLIGSYFIEKKGKRLFWILNLYFMVAFVFWNFSFGYLRYGLILEILGGFILFIWWQKLKLVKIKWKAIGIVGVIIFSIFLAWRDKIAINLGMAYDLSWRRGFVYNTKPYLDEKNNFFNNNIWIDDGGYSPEIYLNCSVPDLTYYSVSSFNNLPVVNIDRISNLATTRNKTYMDEVAKRIKKYNGKTRDLKFVTIVVNGGVNDQYIECKENLKSLKYSVEKEVSVDSFLGYKNKNFIVIFGKMDL